MTALISVSDKTGIVEFARALHQRGIALLSTGGTARLLADAGLPVTEVAEVTGFPEMLDGRVKTLHPRIHGGLLARRDLPAHMAALARARHRPIDLLVINLYPFAQTMARADCTLDDAIENIDIGGPAMLRAAAKNWQDVGVVIDPADYAQVLAELDAGGAHARHQAGVGQEGVRAHRGLRRHDRQLPRRACCPAPRRNAAQVPRARAYPAVFNLQLVRSQDAALRREPAPERRLLPRARCRPPARWRTPGSCRARSSATTTSPTPMRRGNASRPSTSRRA